MDGLWFLWVDIKLLWNLTTWQWILMILKTTDGIRRLYDGISFISEWSEPWDFLQKSCWYEALQMKSFVVVFCHFYNWKLEQGSSNFVATYTTSSNLGRLNSSWMAKSTQNYSNVISLFSGISFKTRCRITMLWWLKLQEWMETFMVCGVGLQSRYLN